MCLIITEIINYTERIKDTMGQLKQSRTWHKKILEGKNNYSSGKYYIPEARKSGVHYIVVCVEWCSR